MTDKHLVTLKGVRLIDWNNEDRSTFLMEREFHKMDLAMLEMVVRRLKLPLEEMGAYQHGTYFHLECRQRTMPIIYGRSFEVTNGYALVDDCIVDVELELTSDQYFGRINLKINSIRFVRNYLTH